MEDRIVDNMPLVNYVVKKFFSNLQHRCEWDEMLQIGYIGLIKAAEKFDEDYGVAFSTYAVPVIKGEINRYFRDYMFGRSEKKKEFKKNIVSLDATLSKKEDGKLIPFSDCIENRADYIKEFEDREYIKDIYNSLNSREKELFKYRYIEDMKQTDIANKMKISQVQVSRLETAMRKRIKARFAEKVNYG